MPRKKTIPSEVKPQEAGLEENPIKTSLTASIFSKIKQRNFIIALAVIILLGVLYSFKGQFIVALVNGQPISRFTLISELEKQSGKQALESLITKILILQEAQKQKVTVSEEEINKEIQQLEENFASRGQNLDQLLALQEMTREGLKEQAKIQKIVEKIVGKDIGVTEQEVENYLKENKDLLPKDSNLEETKAQVKQQLEQQKLNEKIQSWIKSLQDSAKIIYFR